METDTKSRFRHDFRTYLNHVVGFSEILKEESGDRRLKDLHSLFASIRATSIDVRNLADGYFKTLDPEDRSAFASFRGRSSDLLKRVLGFIAKARKKLPAEKSGGFAVDIDQMERSAKSILGLFDIYTADNLADSSAKPVGDDEAVRNNYEGTKSKFPGRILVVDDDRINRELMVRYLNRQGHTVCMSSNGNDALLTMSKVPFDLVILDVMMPSIDGYMVLNVIKDDPCLQDTPVIVISALEDSRSMARCIELGAEDYLPREFEPVILKARIDACLEKRRIKIQRETAIRTILESQKVLRSELRGAADYVFSLLPPALDTQAVEADWQFIPSQSLGGDIFNYAFLEEHLFSFYLIDVSGHGIEAALVSVTIMNMLKSQTLAGADYRDPASVLRALNEAFRSEDQNNLYFTVWYGVYDDRTRMLTYSSGGAVPAVLADSSGSFELLSTEGMVIGVDQSAVYDSKAVEVRRNATVCLFSDGIFEVSTDDSRMLGLHDFAGLVAKAACVRCDMGTMLQSIIAKVRALSTSGMFEDDVSLFAFRFKG